MAALTPGPDPAPFAALRADPLPLPHALPLANGAEIIVDRWLRVVPGRRLVGRARWQDRRVLLKAFVDPARAERHLERALAGAALLEAASLPTPASLASASAHGVALLLQPWLGDEQPAPGLASASLEPAARQARLAEAATLLARLHEAGLEHQDLHLDNLLLGPDGLVLIDADAVARAAGLDQRAAALRALGRWLGQLAPHEDHAAPLAAYLAARGGAWRAGPELASARAAAWRARVDQRLRKVQRSSRRFVLRRRPGQRALLAADQEAELATLLEDPDAAMAAGRWLKQGRSSSVAAVQLGDREVVLKRYQLKSPWHALKRCLRRSRALKSWLAAQLLDLADVATPRPLALLERRWGPLVGTCYLVTELVTGTRGDEVLAAPDPPAIAALQETLRRLDAAGIAHGDCKPTNLWWTGDRWSLVDLDATRLAGPATRAKDRERLTRDARF